MMLTRFIRSQLIIFLILTVLALLALGLFYLRLPSVAGIGQYQLKVELPAAGGLYRTANVTYRGATIGKVTGIEPTEKGALATLSISDKFKVPVDSTANVHSVTAVGEQYIDLVSEGSQNQYFQAGQTITKSTIPQPIGPALDNAYKALAALPTDKIPGLLDETALAVGGLGPTLQRLVDNTQSFVTELKNNITDIDDIVDNAPPIFDSQVVSADSIYTWAANLNSLTRQAKQQDAALSSALREGAPTAERLNTLFVDVQDSLPQTVANLEIIIEMLKRYNKGVEQALVLLPQAAAAGESVSAPFPGEAVISFALTINQPPPCLTGYLPAPQWRPCPIPVSSRWRMACIAGFRRKRHRTWCAERGTSHVLTFPVSVLLPRTNAVAMSRTCPSAPTRGTAIPTRSSTARRQAHAAISRRNPDW